MVIRTEEDAAVFVARYTAVWNESDGLRRAECVAGLWAEDGVEFTDTREFRGRKAVEGRVAEAHGQFVATGKSRVVAGDEVAHHHNALSFALRLVPAAGGEAFWAADVFVVLDENGQIQRDYQFTGAEAATRGVVSELLTRLTASDPSQIAELFAEQVDRKPDWPDERGGSVLSVLVDGPDAVVLGETHRTVKAAGTPYVAPFALRLTVQNGLIARYHVYETHDHA